MSGFAWGVLSTVGLSLLVALFDRESRRDLVGALWALLALPLLLVSATVTGLSRLVYRPRRLSPAALVRIAETARYRGVLISRRHRAVLVITDPRRKERAAALRGDTP
jgi:hypothetical protein